MDRSIPFAIAMSALLSLVAFAQTPTAPRHPAAPSPRTAGGVGVVGRIATINRAAFRVGIQELKVRLEALDKEFEPKGKELQALQDEINKLKTKIQTQGPTLRPSVRDGWIEQGVELEKTFKRKSEDYQTLFQRRGQELTAPVYDKVGKFLVKYAQQHGITMVMDETIARESGLLIFAVAENDITEDFIKEYNRVSASAAQAPATPRRP